MVDAASRSAAVESVQHAPWKMAVVKIGLGHGSYLLGDYPTARQSAEEALAMITVDQPLWRIGALYVLSLVLTDEGRLEAAESLAREAAALVDRFGLQGVPQATWASIALGRVLAERGQLDEAQRELESGILARRSRDLIPWPTLIGLLALARVRFAQGDRAGARALLEEARTIVEAYPDAGVIPALIERQERELKGSRRRETALTEELTARELAVLRQFDSDDSYRQIGQGLYVTVNTVKTHVRSIYRKLGVSSRDEALERAREKALI